MTTLQDTLMTAIQYRNEGNFGFALAIAQKVVQTDPSQFDAWCLLGDVSRRLGDLEQSVSAYRNAIEIRTDQAEIRLELGNCYFMQNRLDDAVDCYQQAIRLRPSYPQAFTNLGSIYQERGQLERAISHHQQALRLDPSLIDANYNLGNAFKELGHNASAAASFRIALQLNPDFAQAHLNLGLTLLLMGQLEEGWPHYEWRFRCGQPKPRVFDKPRWYGAPQPGKTLLVYTEQGYGDILMFSRYLLQLRSQSGMQVVLECPPAMKPILSRLPGIDRIVSHGSELPEFDFEVPLLSLPGCYQTTLGTIPSVQTYLSADPSLHEKWRHILGSRPEFKIGIAWQGDPTYRWDHLRSVPLRFFAKIAKLDGVQIYSLQKGHGTNQIGENSELFTVNELGGRVDVEHGAFMDSAAIMKHLDLVISPDTAIVHLAGALGVPTWLALPTVPHWPWMMDREDSPWYASMRLFRQKKAGQWDEVFERMAIELRNLTQSSACLICQ
jgi:cytochrome c-type biogenesis protein CcmH/NrfG